MREKDIGVAGEGGKRGGKWWSKGPEVSAPLPGLS